MKLFKEFNVWERTTSESLICYRCFQIIPDGGYCVQSADHYYRENKNDFKKQFLELLLEESPDMHSNVFASIIEAVEDFKTQFEN